MPATLEGVHPELRTRCEGVLLESNGAIWVNEGYRDWAGQVAMYAKMVAAKLRYGSKWRDHAALAAVPGTSKHGRKPAEAVDIGCAFKDNPLRARLVTRWGLHTPIDGEPWHVELAPNRGSIPKVSLPTKEEASMKIKKPAVAIIGTPSGLGYWVFAADGGVFAYGDAQFHGSAADIKLEAPIVAADVTPTAAGYWLLGADGGVFAFGDAAYFGNPTEHIK